MSNMSYCRFHNTLIDLRDCRENLWDGDLSEDEARARKNLIAVCRAILNEVDSYGDEDDESAE